MIPPEVLYRKTLFSLLYKIDQDLAERTRAIHCPFAGGRCTAPITGESLEVAPLILTRHSKFVSACAAVVKAAGAGCCHHLFGFGAAEYTGRRWFCWSRPFARGRIRPSRLNASKDCTGYGARRSNGGNAISEIFFPRPTAFDAWPDALCPQSIRTSCPKNCCPDFTKWITTPSRQWPIAWQRLFWARDGPQC